MGRITVEFNMIGKESKANFKTLMDAAKNDDISVVSCKDAKGREFQVLCVLGLVDSSVPKYAYLPFALMMTPSLYSLMNKIEPPESLKGEWVWDDDDEDIHIA